MYLFCPVLKASPNLHCCPSNPTSQQLDQLQQLHHLQQLDQLQTKPVAMVAPVMHHQGGKVSCLSTTTTQKGDTRC